jgi:hypothetical protein
MIELLKKQLAKFLNKKKEEEEPKRPMWPWYSDDFSFNPEYLNSKLVSNWTRMVDFERMKFKSQLFAYGDYQFPLVYETFLIKDCMSLYNIEFKKPTECIFYVRMTDDGGYKILDYCTSKNELDFFIQLNVPEDILKRERERSEDMKRLLTTWRSLVGDNKPIQIQGSCSTGYPKSITLNFKI